MLKIQLQHIHYNQFVYINDSLQDFEEEYILWDTFDTKLLFEKNYMNWNFVTSTAPPSIHQYSITFFLYIYLDQVLQQLL